MKARKTTIIHSVMVQQLSFLTVLSALSKLSTTRCTLPLCTQWHHKVFKYFIYILSPIYICTAKRAKHLRKYQVLHNICMNIFAFFPKPQSRVIFFHTVSLICQKTPYNSIYIKEAEEQAEQQLSSFMHFLVGEKKGGIHFRYYLMYILRKMTTKNRFTKFI